MIELASLGTFLEILQKAFDLIDKHKNNKSKLFTECIDPLYEDLSPVVEEYYKFFRYCRDEFSEATFKDFKKVLIKVKKQREEIVIARNKVLGITDSFRSKQYDTIIKKNQKLDNLLYHFVRAIHLFFYMSDDCGMTGASSLFRYIEEVIYRRDKSEKEKVVDQIEHSLRRMEDAWHTVSYYYGELRMFCMS